MRENEQTLEDVIIGKEITKALKFFSSGDDIDIEDKFQYFVSAHLSYSKQQVAEEHIRHFRNKLDRKIYGKHRRIYKAVFIEKGDFDNERHCHLLIHKPKHLTKAQFEKQFNTLWQQTCGSMDIVWKRITLKEGGIGGLLTYLNKQVKTKDLHRAFLEELSDNSYQQKHRQSTRHTH